MVCLEMNVNKMYKKIAKLKRDLKSAEFCESIWKEARFRISKDYLEESRKNKKLLKDKFILWGLVGFLFITQVFLLIAYLWS